MATKQLKRVKIAEAAEMLGVSAETVERMLRRDLFTCQRDTKEGTSPRFLFLDEVETYVEANAGGTGEQGERAVLALRVEKRRKRR